MQLLRDNLTVSMCLLAITVSVFIIVGCYFEPNVLHLTNMFKMRLCFPTKRKDNGVVTLCVHIILCIHVIVDLPHN